MDRDQPAATQKLGNAGTPSDTEPLAPSGNGGASLVLIHPPMPEIGLRRPLCKSVMVVGRDESADLTVTRGSVSRRHAELRRGAGGEWQVADMGSTNGTYLNDEEVEDAGLVDGDHVQFGDAIFKFVLADSAAYHDKVYSVTVLDGITSIYNQRYFFSHVDKQMAKAHHVKSDMALIIIDIDWFSDLNEERGGLCGDAVLRTLARRISLQAKSGHVSARIGGEEFAVFMPGAELDDALDLAESIREAVDCEAFAFEGNDFEVSVSIGVAASAEGELSARQLVTEARKQLTAAKENGRNCVAP
ncbi:MAG: GGDEF domain-containing protein [Myxococcales bacterium]|nr:GGDEF domain-containing protein [Myxococcales bacterium]